MRDVSDDLTDLQRRVSDAHAYLRVDEARRRLAELEAEASKPDLWDDTEHARKVTTELSNVKEDVDLVDGLDRRLSDVSTLYDLAREEGDESLDAEINDAITSLRHELDRLELRALFTGEHDERDAIC